MTDEKEFEAWKAHKKYKAHIAIMNKWVIERRRKIHEQYTLALGVFDEVHARPMKFTLESAEEALGTALSV